MFACILGGISIGHAQVGGGATGISATPGAAFGGLTDPSMVQVMEGFKIIPSVSVAERYDSNVFFIPKSFRVDRSDYVTTVAPQLRGLYAGSLARLNVMGGAVGEYYIKNRGLNYVGVNAAISLDLSPVLDRLWSGTKVTVSDAYRFTPQAPAFFTGDLNGDEINPFVKGFQAGRVNSRSNVFSATFAAPINQTFSVTGNYSEGFMKYGSIEAAQVGQLLDTKYINYGAGLSAIVSARDSLAVNFTGSEFISEASTGGSFTTRGGTVGWTHAFSHSTTITSTGGVQNMEGRLNNTAIPSTLAPSGSVRLAWKDRTTTLMALYGVSVQPTFQFESQALLVHSGTFTVTQETPIPELFIVAGVNAAIGDQYGSQSGTPISYNSYGGSGGILYKISSKTFMGMNYSYMNFENKFGDSNFAFDRHIVQFNLTQAFY